MEATTRPQTPLLSGNGAGDSNIDKAAAGVHGAVDRMASAADRAVRGAEPVIARVAQVSHQAVNRVSDVAGPAVDWLSRRGRGLMESQRKVTADTAEYVSAHPWKSLGLALAAGYLISRFTR